jgi:hypothetical protein
MIIYFSRVIKVTLLFWLKVVLEVESIEEDTMVTTDIEEETMDMERDTETALQMDIRKDIDVEEDTTTAAMMTIDMTDGEVMAGTKTVMEIVIIEATEDIGIINLTEGIPTIVHISIIENDRGMSLLCCQLFESESR